MEKTLKPSNISQNPLPNTFNQLKIQRSRTISIVSKCCLSVAIKSKKSQNSLSYCDKAKNLKKLECIESKMECSLDKKGTQVANSRWRQTKLTCYINGCLPMRFLGTLHKVRCMKCQSGFLPHCCYQCF